MCWSPGHKLTHACPSRYPRCPHPTALPSSPPTCRSRPPASCWRDTPSAGTASALRTRWPPCSSPRRRRPLRCCQPRMCTSPRRLRRPPRRCRRRCTSRHHLHRPYRRSGPLMLRWIRWQACWPCGAADGGATAGGMLQPHNHACLRCASTSQHAVAPPSLNAAQPGQLAHTSAPLPRQLLISSTSRPPLPPARTQST